MPDINGQPVKNLNNKNCGCCSCFFTCCKKSDNDQEHIIVNHSTENVCPHYVDDLPDPLEPGTIIKITGLVQSICSRFAVNLTTSREIGCDIALHLNPRISQRYIVRNSRIKNHWGTEEVTSISNFELNRNEKFELDITLSDKEYFISVNGKHVCAYVYRIPLINVKTLLIEGPVEVNNVEYGKTDTYPAFKELQRLSKVLLSGDLQEIVDEEQLTLPLTVALDDGFQQGWQVEIDGTVKILPINFVVNLQDGSHLWPHPNVQLHLNPRFGYSNTKHVFVTNAWIDGVWGQEERLQAFPFIPASPFKLAIRKNDDHFSIWVDGKMIGEFKYRSGVENINTLYIQGDVNVSRVCLRHSINDKYFHKSRQSLASSLESGEGGTV